jgi:triosephosphate isomerase
MVKKTLIGVGFKMRKNVKDSISYAKLLYDFVKNNIDNSMALEIFFLPSFLVLYPISKIFGNSIKLGAQNCWHEDEGSFTGEISPRDLKEIGCKYVEVGHPERRNIFKEDDELINKKVLACIRNDLYPLLFIGDREKYEDKKILKEILENQLKTYLKSVKKEDLAKVVLAYEPVWAIDAKNAAPVDYIHDSLVLLREIIKDNYDEEISKNQMIFYGGSVNLSNAAQILKIENNDGISSGRGALDPEQFIKILNIVIEFKTKKS